MKTFMDRFRKNFSGSFSIPAIIFVIVALLIMNDKGTTAAFGWLAVVFMISFFLRPYLPSRSISFPHGAFGLSFGLGLFLIFFLSWSISAITGCEYSDTVIHLCFAVLICIGYAIRKYILKEEVTITSIKETLNGFAVFAVIFVAFFWIIGYNPLVDPGTENFMDFGFLQTIYRQKSAFPIDPWYSGTKLDHYYYLGQAMVVCLCRLAHTTPEYCYNMMLATFAGMVFSMVYELCGAIFSALVPDQCKKNAGERFAGIIGGCVAAFGGNPHWFLYGICKPLLGKLTGDDQAAEYWFPDGTVYINMEFGDPDNGKSEFPAYSTILGDLHAHVINVLFVLPLVAVLFELVMSYKDEDKKEDRYFHIYSLIIMSLLLGYYKGANYWDFAIYFVITGAVITFADIKNFGFNMKTILRIATKAAVVIFVSVVSILPFTMHFVKMESGIGICENHTPVSKFLVLWLIPIAVAVLFIFLLYRGRKEETQTLNDRCRAPLLALALCTIGLVVTPEVVYIKDIYGEANARFNTMFKLTYQAVVLFAILYGLAAGLLLQGQLTAISKAVSSQKKRKKKEPVKTGRGQKAALICLTVYAICSVSYTAHAAKQWFGNPFDNERLGISTLDGLQDDDVYGFEMEAQKVLMEDDRKVINIVEAAGDSYKHESALSMYSGACTPLGWYVHEWMWHNDPEPVGDRAEQVQYFYSSSDDGYCRDFLKNYDIDYIFVGPAEVCKYPVYSEIFKNYGDICVSTVWEERELFLLKVDKSKL